MIISKDQLRDMVVSFPETNIAPENRVSQKEGRFHTTISSRAMLVSGKVLNYFFFFGWPCCGEKHGIGVIGYP